MQPSNKLPPWLKPKVDLPKLKLSVGWYTAAEWLKVKQAAVDSDRFEASYAEWLVMADGALKDMLAAGLVADKFNIHAEDLLAWCIAHAKVNDAAARAEFVTQQSARRDSNAD
jgi:hypothetical protein